MRTIQRGGALRHRCGLGLWAAAGLVALVGCAQPGPLAPEPPMRDAQAWVGTSAVVQADGALAAQPSAAQPSASPIPSAELAPAWWRSWGDPALDDLVQQALDGAPDLQLAQARWQASRAQASAVLGASGAQAQLAADASLQRFTEVGLVPPAYAGRVRSTGQVQVAASWSPDLWGRQQAQWQAALGEAKAQALAVSAARNALSAAVVQQYVGLAQVLDAAGLLRQELALRQAHQALVRQRVAAGLDDIQAQQQAERPIAELAVQARQLDGQALRLRQQLAVLTAQPPGAVAGLSPTLQALHSGQLPAHLGADLLGRRAEVQAARWRVESARHALRSARAQYYPDVNLNAAIGLNALGLNRLLDLGATQASIGPALRLPLLDADRLDAQQAVRNAERDAAIAQYNAAVRDAVREAADALAVVQMAEQQITAQQAVFASLADSRRTAAQRHAAGLGNRLPVLAAQTAELVLARQTLALSASLWQARAELARALGGGWVDPAR